MKAYMTCISIQEIRRMLKNDYKMGETNSRGSQKKIKHLSQVCNREVNVIGEAG